MSSKAIILTLILIAVITAILLAPMGDFLDFSVYWKGATYLLSGKNPYETPHFATFALANPADAARYSPDDNIQIMGLPLVLTYFLPFALFSLGAAKLLFLIAMIAGVFTSVALLCKKFDVRITALNMLAVFPFGAFLAEIRWGAPEWLCLIGLTLILRWHKSGRSYCVGLAASLLLLKIHLFVLVFALIVGLAVWRREWKIAVGFLIGSFLLIVIPFLIQPRIGEFYWEALHKGQMFQYVNATIPSVIRGALHIKSPAVLLASLIALLIALPFVTTKRALNFQDAVPLVLPLSISFAPYAWGHDYICLVPFLVWAVANESALKPGKQISHRAYLYAASGVFVFLTLIGVGSPLPYIGYLILVLRIWLFHAQRIFENAGDEPQLTRDEINPS